VRRAAIVAPLRTPVGTFGGTLKGVAVEDLAALVVREVISRSGIDPGAVEDLVLAQSYANSETPCVGRWVALYAGLPLAVPGLQIDRRCGGGLQAVVTAAMMVQTGAADVVIAGGVESMSRIEHYSTDIRWGRRTGAAVLYDRLDRGRERAQPEDRFGPISGMVETADSLAAQYGVTRRAADEFAVESHRRAAAAWQAGYFDREVVPVRVPQRRRPDVIFGTDEGVRASTTVDDLEALAVLRPPDGVVTAGNSCQQNDAASACLVVGEDRLDQLGLEPLGFLVDWAAVGCDPAIMGIGPVPAIRKVLSRTGMQLEQFDLVEINEAFACQVLAVLEELKWDDRHRLNVNGSGISLGHPIAATGVRIMTSLLYELRRRGARYGLETMCIGGGQGMAAVFEAA
jgi:acetyl-CoA C-acetyltransferase